MRRARGSVLGIDVGFSAKRKTTCLCLLEWDAERASLTFRVIGSQAAERRGALRELVGGRAVDGVAIDGPLTRGLAHARHYRAAEALLSRGALQKRGKPGQTSAPTGQLLHAHATSLAKQTLAVASVAPSTHREPILEQRVVEAFPNLFLAALLDEHLLPPIARDASDRYWESAVERSTKLVELLSWLLPERRWSVDLRDVRDHEERAGLVCAVTALATANDDHVAVGDPIDGDIILPPASTWGRRLGSRLPWLECELRDNVARVRTGRVAHENHQRARVATAEATWF